MKFLVAIDLDNTLLTSNGEIPNSFFELLSDTIKNNLFRFAIVSGRHLNNIKKLLGKYAEYCDIIAENGATISHNNVIVQDSFIPEKDARLIMSNYSDMFSGVLIYYPQKIILLKSSQRLCLYLENNNVEFEIGSIHINYKNIKKISFYSEIPLLKTPEFKLPENISAEISTPYLLDFTESTISKGFGLSLLQNILECNYWNTITFGDSYPDISMFKNSFFSFAMDNANKEIKSYANFVAPPCNEDGVTSVLRIFKYNTEPIAKFMKK